MRGKKYKKTYPSQIKKIILLLEAKKTRIDRFD
jgi:hypothetical protein